MLNAAIERLRSSAVDDAKQRCDEEAQTHLHESEELVLEQLSDGVCLCFSAEAHG